MFCVDYCIDDFFLAGEFIAMSLVHGGPPPQFLNQKLFDALVEGPENVAVSVENVEDVEYNHALSEVCFFVAFIS